MINESIYKLVNYGLDTGLDLCNKPDSGSAAAG